MGRTSATRIRRRSSASRLAACLAGMRSTCCTDKRCTRRRACRCSISDSRHPPSSRRSASRPSAAGAFQRLDPIPMYRATTSAGEYFGQFS
jgi:hypothetical protein